MRTFTPILLLSLVTLSIATGLRLISHDSTAQLQPVTSGQLLAATQSDHEGNPPLPHGGKPKRFFQSQDNLNS